MRISVWFEDTQYGVIDTTNNGQPIYTGSNIATLQKLVSLYTAKNETEQEAANNLPDRLHGSYWTRDETNVKFNSVHDRGGRFGSSGVGQITGPDHMANFAPKDQGKIVAYAKANGISPAMGIAAGSKLIEASKASGHFNQDADWYNRANSTSEALAKMTGISKEQSAGVIAALSPRNRWDRISKDGQVTKPNVKDALVMAKLYKKNPTIEITQAVADSLQKYDKATGGLSKMVGAKKPLNDYTPTQAAYLSMGHITGFATNTAKGFRILRGEPVGNVLKGPKVRSFYNNIHNPNDHASVTVDTWMIRVLTGKNKATPQELSALLSRPNSGGTRGVGSYPLFADMIHTVATKYNIPPNQAQAVIWEQARREEGQGVSVDKPAGA